MTVEKPKRDWHETVHGPGCTQKLRLLLLLPQNRPNYIVAAQAGMHPTRLSEYSLGRRYIPPHHLIRLCQVLHCEPDDIVGDMNDSHRTNQRI